LTKGRKAWATTGRGRGRRSSSQALAGNFKPHDDLIHLADPRAPRLPRSDDHPPNEEVELRLSPFAHKAENLRTIAGVAERVSQVILAELGPDMSPFTSAVRRRPERRSAPPTAGPRASAAPGAPARRADPARITKRLVVLLERLGLTVNLQTPTTPETGPAPA